MRLPFAILCGSLLFATASARAAEDRDTKVRNDRQDILSAGVWIYNDLSAGFAEARRTGKPLLVVLRCIP